MSLSKEDYDQDLHCAVLLQLIKCAINYNILEPYGIRHLTHVCASDDIPWLVRVPVQRLLLRFHFSLRNSFTGNCTFNEIVKDVVIGIDLPMWPNKKKKTVLRL